MTATRPGLATHYLRYFSGNVLVVLASFVSFPLMARLLDNEQFGILGYYEVWLLVLAGVLKLGSQHAILRFYPHAGDDRARTRFSTTHVLVPLGISLLLWVAACAAAFALRERVDHPQVLALVLLLVPVTIAVSFADWILLTTERSDLSVRVRVVWRWLEVALMVLLVATVLRNALGAFTAKLLAAFVAMTWLWLLVRPHLRFDPSAFDRGALRAGFAFGLPLMANEMVHVAFGFADRLLLKHMLDDYAAVGVYTIGYGLAVAMTGVLHQALYQAFTPVAVRTYEQDGDAAVVALKRATLGPMLHAIALVTALLLVAGADLFLLIAGDAKRESAPVFVWSALTLAWFPLFDVAGYGLLLQKRARRYLAVTFSAGLVNIALNLALIPRYGVMGAVLGTAISYAVLACVHVAACPKSLRGLPTAATFAAAIVAAAAALAIGDLILLATPEGRLTRLFAGGVIAFLAYTAVALFADRALRALLIGQWRRIRGRPARAAVVAD